MKQLTNKNKYFAVLLIILLSPAGCQLSKTSILKLRYSPSNETSGAATTSQSINLLKFEDAREESITPEVIGHREAAFNVSMGDVHTDMSISEIIHKAFGSELIKNGYQIVDAGEDLLVAGKILNFWVGTDVTPLYWDVYGEVRIEIEVKKANGDIAKIGPYYAKNIERTYTNPSIPIMERVLLASIKEIIMYVLSDKEFIE